MGSKLKLGLRRKVTAGANDQGKVDLVVGRNLA